MAKTNKTNISKIIKETAEQVVKEIKDNNMLKQDLSYYKKVEILLYRYNDIKEAVKQKEEAIKDLETYGAESGKSKSIVVYRSGGSNITAEERYIELKAKYEVEKKETERYLNLLKLAIDKIKDDKYYFIIEKKYLGVENMTDDKLAEEVQKDRRTILRNKKRLINKLITILFPESIKDLL